MIVFRKEDYKGVTISYSIREDGGIHANALGFLHDKSHRGHETKKQAELDIKEQIDLFLEKTPKNWNELAEAIEDSLVWESYEDCHVDPDNLKILIENFLKYKYQ